MMKLMPNLLTAADLCSLYTQDFSFVTMHYCTKSHLCFQKIGNHVNVIDKYISPWVWTLHHWSVKSLGVHEMREGNSWHIYCLICFKVTS